MARSPLAHTLLALSMLCWAQPLRADCAESGRRSSIDDIVAQVHSQDLRYVFIGERHDVGPVKRFAVDLVNALSASGVDAGLYVEGFRTDCKLGDFSCWSLARAFNVGAFQALLAESTVAVHAIDPPQRDRRAARMAAAIAAGEETVRVVLVGKTHVVHAWDPEAELWVYGGGLRYPDPGDLAEAFPPARILTIGLQTTRDTVEAYGLRHSDCGFDYVVTTSAATDYWGRAPGARPGDDGPEPPLPVEVGAVVAPDRSTAETVRPARVPRP